MANKKVRLTKQVKLTDVYTEKLLEELSAKVLPEDFEAFLSRMVKTPWRYCPVAIDAQGRYRFGRVKLPDIKKVEGPEVGVDRRVGSYHLDYRENGTRMCPAVLKVLHDFGKNLVTADNLAPTDILDAIGRTGSGQRACGQEQISIGGKSPTRDSRVGSSKCTLG
jgi:hypothetical protein